MARELENRNTTLFVGRLANYKYFNMDEAILNAMQLFYKETGIPLSQHYSNNSTVDSKTKNATTLTIVISHCHENMTWIYSSTIFHLCKNFRTHIVIYEKCNEKSSVNMSFVDMVKGLTIEVYSLDNVGREGYAFLDFLLSKSSRFSDLNLFLQAGLHAKLETVVNQVIRMYRSVKKFAARENVGDNVKLSKHFHSFFPGHCYLTDRKIPPHWNGSCDMIRKITGGSCRVSTQCS